MTLIIENILDWGLKEKIIYYYELIMDVQKVKYNPDVSKTERWFDYKTKNNETYNQIILQNNNFKQQFCSYFNITLYSIVIIRKRKETYYICTKGKNTNRSVICNNKRHLMQIYKFIDNFF